MIFSIDLLEDLSSLDINAIGNKKYLTYNNT